MILIHTCDMPHSYVRHDPFMYGTWPIRMRNMARAYMGHGLFIRVMIYVCRDLFTDVKCFSFIRATWLLYMCDMTHHLWNLTHWYVRHSSLIYGTWLIHMCVDSFIHVKWFSCTHGTWLIHMCDVCHSCMELDPFVCVTWLTHIWDMARSYMGHDSFICVTWHDDTMCAMIHLYVMCVMIHLDLFRDNEMMEFVILSRFSSWKWNDRKWNDRTWFNRKRDDQVCESEKIKL